MVTTINQQKEFNNQLKESMKQVGKLLAIYQNGKSGYDYEVSIETALKESLFALERV